jgi:alpha,alpha-trehalase
VIIEWTENPEGKDVDREIPSVLEHMEAFVQEIEGKRLAVFLDYDGTLTPIVDRPELATLSEGMRETIKHLGEYCPIAIVSGRDRSDVQELVGLDTVVYAGSHGFDIIGPDNLHLQHKEGRKSWPALRAAANELDRKLCDITGVKVERKEFGVAVHFRLVNDSLVPKVKRIVETVANQHPELRITGGKKVFELRPAIDWDKGKAVAWLLEALALGEDTVPIYIGDDETDEDAFHALKMRGIGILVAQASQSTEARYGLRDPDEVKGFLTALIAVMQKREL